MPHPKWALSSAACSEAEVALGGVGRAADAVDVRGLGLEHLGTEHGRRTIADLHGAAAVIGELERLHLGDLAAADRDRHLHVAVGGLLVCAREGSIAAGGGACRCAGGGSGCGARVAAGLGIVGTLESSSPRFHRPRPHPSRSGSPRYCGGGRRRHPRDGVLHAQLPPAEQHDARREHGPDRRPHPHQSNLSRWSCSARSPCLRASATTRSAHGAGPQTYRSEFATSGA